MPIAEGSLSTITVGQSSTEGAQPGAGANNYITPTGHTLAPGADSFTLDDISSSRKPRAVVRTNTRGDGDISFHWRAGTATEDLIESALGGAFGTPVSGGSTFDFGAPAASGSQQIDDALTGNAFSSVTTGDLVVISGAANAGNNGAHMVLRKENSNKIYIYNADGVTAFGDAGCSVANQGVATIGSTKLYIWSERMFNDGTNDIYSELYGDMIASRFSLRFSASRPSEATVSFLGDVPILAHANGSPPVASQLINAPNAATTNRSIYSMEDVKEIVIVENIPPAAINTLILHDKCSEWSFTIDNTPRQDFAVGGAGAINTSLVTPTLTGTVSAYIDAVTFQTSNLAAFLKNNPDDIHMYVRFGDGTNEYGAFFDGLNITGAATPISDGASAVLLNATWSATDIRITKTV